MNTNTRNETSGRNTPSMIEVHQCPGLEATNSTKNNLGETSQERAIAKIFKGFPLLVNGKYGNN